MSINTPESGPPKVWSDLRFLLSDWGDLNSRPSVPQVGRPLGSFLNRRRGVGTGP